MPASRQASHLERSCSTQPLAKSRSGRTCNAGWQGKQLYLRKTRPLRKNELEYTAECRVSDVADCLLLRHQVRVSYRLPPPHGTPFPIGIAFQGKSAHDWSSRINRVSAERVVKDRAACKRRSVRMVSRAVPLVSGGESRCARRVSPPARECGSIRDIARLRPFCALA